ncbi:MAG: prepilin-type N-terminal cleavage/methylation domain-containing protein [Desulfobacterales bacterium]|nr:prepilin-type N-terminal cleavage/methylation domain-containing protein [Desulfobacterales bacterium]
MKSKFNAGFTLIEIIVCLIIISIVAASLVDFLRTSSTLNTKKVTDLRDSNNLKRVMESITADYRSFCQTGNCRWTGTSVPLTQCFSKNNLNTYKTSLKIDQNVTISRKTNVAGDPDVESVSKIGKDDSTIAILQVSVTIGDQSLATLLTR